jgi:2'-5' RNA ligase
LRALRTALVLVLEDARPVLEPLRARFHADAVTGGIPLHITVLFPFVDPAAVPEDELAELCSSFAPLDFELTRLAEFPGVVYAVPEPDDQLVTLMRAVHGRFPETPPYGGVFEDVVPHATLAEGVPLEVVEPECTPLLPIACHVDEVTLLAETAVERWSVAGGYALGGAPDVRP